MPPTESTYMKQLDKRQHETLRAVFDSFLDVTGWGKEDVEEAFQLYLVLNRAAAIFYTEEA
jgi:hypothetical protein